MKTNSLLLSSILTVLACSSANAQLLFSFESGLEGWVVNSPNAALGTSPNGATDGAQAMAVTQTDDGFNWNVKRDNAGMDAFYTAINKAVMAGQNNYFLDLDI